MGPREQRSYSEDETDRSARTGGLGGPKDDDVERFWNDVGMILGPQNHENKNLKSAVRSAKKIQQIIY